MRGAKTCARARQEGGPTAAAIVSSDDTIAPGDLRRNVAILIGGSLAIAVASALTLPVPAVLAREALGVLMVAGASESARGSGLATSSLRRQSAPGSRSTPCRCALALRQAARW